MKCLTSAPSGDIMQWKNQLPEEALELIHTARADYDPSVQIAQTRCIQPVEIIESTVKI